MRRGFGLIGLVVTAIVLVIVGVIAYNVGWSDGVNTHLPAVTNDGTTNVPAYYYYGHPGWGGPGFGIFGIFFFLFVLFGIFFLLRLLFWGFMGRAMMGGGWGGGWGHRGWGYGPGGQGRQSFEERVQEWHRKQHGEQSPGGTTPPPPPPSDTRTV